MSSGFIVDADELRDHAAHLDALVARIGAVMDASSHIQKDEEAYGLLCSWMTWVMEGRHQDQDDITGYVAQNLELCAAELRDAADLYDGSDVDAESAMRLLQEELES